MFLDDQLLEICKNADCSTPESVQELNKTLCQTCENYYKSKIHPTITKEELKVVLNRTFNLWDGFVRQALKGNEKMKILGELFQKFSFKEQFLSNPEISEIYKKL